jgi:hypothetical protein
VPDTLKDAQIIYQFGKEYLKELSLSDASIDAQECRYCHIEEASEEVISAIDQKGYYILRMDDIPTTLSPSPSRREIIMYVRATKPDYRFTNFSGKSSEDLLKLID